MVCLLAATISCMCLFINILFYAVKKKEQKKNIMQLIIYFLYKTADGGMGVCGHNMVERRGD